MFRKLFRLIHIAWIWQKYDLSSVVFAIPALRGLRFLSFCNPFYWLSARRLSPGERLRAALEELGPIFIKFGQVLSTRRDVLPDAVATALAKLQDQVEPFDGALAQRMIEKAWGQPIDSVCEDFNPEPIAAASIAQVHGATLKTGERVVIKVLRPRIRRLIKKDVDVMLLLAKWLERMVPRSRRLHPVEVVHEMAGTLYDELDLLREAGNASQLKRNFPDSPMMYVPDVYFDYCRQNVMVMERIEGVNISDVEKMKACGTDMKLLAEYGVEIFYTQVFRDCFFHADMHPGNIFVDISKPEAPRYMAIDFGIMGTLNDEDKRYLALNFLAFFQQNYREVARLHIESGWVNPNTRVGDLEGAIRSVCEPIFNKPLSEVSFAQTLLRLLQVAKRYEMEVQPQLLLLQKTLLNVEGVGRLLYPELDLWVTAKPFLERWMRTQVGPRAFLRTLKNEWPMLQESLPKLPHLLCEYLESNQSKQQTEASTQPTQPSYSWAWF